MSTSAICYVTEFGVVRLSGEDAQVTDGMKFTKRGDIDKRQRHAKEKNEKLATLERRLGVSRSQLAQIRK